MKIQPVEQEKLNRVFDHLCAYDKSKTDKSKIGPADILLKLKELVKIHEEHEEDQAKIRE